MLGHIENKDVFGASQHGFTKGKLPEKFDGLLLQSYGIGG